ncbi:MAG: hypothetical protein ACOX5J_17525 [Candidatus Hydrogenedentales bacterium]
MHISTAIDATRIDTRSAMTRTRLSFCSLSISISLLFFLAMNYFIICVQVVLA